MRFSVSKINPDYDFDITGASYAGNPISGTAMYITGKVEKLLKNLKDVSDCLVFIETGMEPEDALTKKNCFVVSDNPQMVYARFMTEFAEEKFREEAKRKYRLIDGYYMGEGVEIGEDVYIEPGCLIGHDVQIGAHCRIMAGTVIKNSVIGDYFVCGENAVVGADGFTMAEDGQGNKFRIPTMGKVIIGDHVEIGQLDSICVGQGGNTIIRDYVKIDALVHIGHDDCLGKNAEIPAGAIVGGYVNIGEKAYIGINAVIRNRVDIGAESLVGMGAVVTKRVEEHTTVIGNPAKEFIRNPEKK